MARYNQYLSSVLGRNASSAPSISLAHRRLETRIDFLCANKLNAWFTMVTHISYNIPKIERFIIGYTLLGDPLKDPLGDDTTISHGWFSRPSGTELT